MTVRATWEVLYSGPEFFVIRDLARENETMSITNDAEAVVALLIEDGSLDGPLNLYYYDTFDDLDEIVYRNGQFVRFGILRKDHQLNIERTIRS